MKMIKIDYNALIIKQKPIKKWESGCYLVKGMKTNEIVFISVCGNSIHYFFKSGIEYDPINNTTFDLRYKLIKKIKHFTITNIKVDNKM